MFEMIDVQHQTSEVALIASGSRQFFIDAHLQVATVMPPGQYVSETTAKQARPVDHVLDTERRNDPKVCKEISCMRSCETRLVLAPQVNTADQLLAVSQRDHRDACEPRRTGADQLMVTS